MICYEPPAGRNGPKPGTEKLGGNNDYVPATDAGSRFMSIDFNLWRKTASYGGFDYSSIMLYGGSEEIIMTREYTGKKYNSWGGTVGDASGIVSEDRLYGPDQSAPYNYTPYNIFISEQDARTVKQLYE